MKNWKWKGCCYYAEVSYPHGFCRECWEAHGRPKAMDMTRFPHIKDEQ